jgi:hypothetical protein
MEETKERTGYVYERNAPLEYTHRKKGKELVNEGKNNNIEYSH